jgi:meso-butanediol dehydrogenase/(S,S)-butanediol dehydrogenase/diacetyl reductase
MNRNVVITGGSKGIGRAMVDAFLREGDRVVFTARGEADAISVLDEKKEECTAGRLFFLKGDVSSEENVKALAEMTQEQLGGCDVLINNAAIFCPGAVHENSADDFDALFAVNVRGVFLTCKYFVPQMLKKGKGAVINVASLAGLNGSYNMALYAATKAAVVGLTRSMAMDYMRYGVRVNGICPSATLTDMFVKGNDEAVIELFKSINPARRLGEPGEIADAAVFLASDQSGYMAGQMLSVDGGLAAWNGEALQPRKLPGNAD